MPKWKVLAIFCGQKAEGVASAGPIDEILTPLPHIEVLVLRNKKLEELGEQLLVWQPNIVYFSGESGRHPSTGRLPVLTWRATDSQTEGDDDLGLIFQGLAIDTAFFDAPGCTRHADLVRTMGVQNVIFWATASPQASHAATFSRAFFASLREPLGTPLEAYAIATQVANAHCATTLQNDHTVLPVLPQLLSNAEPSLPDMASIPEPLISGAHVITGSMAGVAGWDDIRLVAPHAEVRLLVCGGPNLLESKRLGALALALRAVLVQEVRSATVESAEACTRPPPHLPPDTTVLRCCIRTCSGAAVTVVLGGPPAVMQRREVVELAVRHTLAADSLSLQLRLPPAGAPPVQAKAVNHVAHGCGVIDAVAITSVWAVAALRSLGQDAAFRGLAVLGIAAVGGTPTAGLTQTHSAHFSAFAPNVPRPPAGKRSQHAIREDSFDSWGLEDEDEAARRRKKRQRSRLAPDEEIDIGEEAAQPRENIPYESRRRSIHECTEAEWREDYCSFCSSQMGRRVTPDSWPDAVLNGLPLDVFNLYKEVVTRGGFGMGNGINWKGQIFPKMRNYTPSHKMTGIGNALKTKYQQLLLEYESAHPEDVTTDTCSICGGGEEVATDWVSCDRCNTWVHFSCDDRAGLGAFKDYAKTDGMSYVCAPCSGY